MIEPGKMYVTHICTLMPHAEGGNDAWHYIEVWRDLADAISEIDHGSDNRTVFAKLSGPFGWDTLRMELEQARRTVDELNRYYDTFPQAKKPQHFAPEQGSSPCPSPE